MTVWPRQSPLATGMACKCPRCGEGRLFRSYLKVKPRCDVCDLDFAFADSADGPAVLLMFVIGFVIVGGALVLEFARQPPLWVHMVIWLPLATVLTLAALPPLKGLAIALQYTNRAGQGRLIDKREEDSRDA